MLAWLASRSLPPVFATSSQELFHQFCSYQYRHRQYLWYEVSNALSLQSFLLCLLFFTLLAGQWLPLAFVISMWVFSFVNIIVIFTSLVLKIRIHGHKTWCSQISSGDVIPTFAALCMHISLHGILPAGHLQSLWVYSFSWSQDLVWLDQQQGHNAYLSLLFCHSQCQLDTLLQGLQTSAYLTAQILAKLAKQCQHVPDWPTVFDHQMQMQTLACCCILIGPRSSNHR